jgi:hypothetical protein
MILLLAKNIDLNKEIIDMADLHVICYSDLSFIVVASGKDKKSPRWALYLAALLQANVRTMERSIQGRQSFFMEVM